MALEFIIQPRADFIIVKRVPSKHADSEGSVRTFSSTTGGYGNYNDRLQYVEADIQLLVDGLQALSDRRDQLWENRESQDSSTEEHPK